MLLNVSICEVWLRVRAVPWLRSCGRGPYDMFVGFGQDFSFFLERMQHKFCSQISNAEII